MKHILPFEPYKTSGSSFHNYGNIGPTRTRLIKKPKIKTHNLSMGPVKPKNLPNYHSPLYTPSTHIKVNPVKRNSQKHINTNLSITLNPFKSSTQASSTINSGEYHTHKGKSPITSISNKFYTINNSRILSQGRKRKSNEHNSSDNATLTNKNKSISNKQNTTNTCTILNKDKKRTKPHSQEKIMSSIHSNNKNSITYALNGNKKLIQIHKQKIINTSLPTSLYTNVHKRATSSLSSNVSQNKNKQTLNKGSSSSSSTHKHTSNNISGFHHNTSTNVNTIPFKKIRNILTISKQGMDLQSTPKINQDSYFVSTIPININNNNSKYKYIGVCDGHGPNGHFVSTFLKETLPKELTKHLQKKTLQPKHFPKQLINTYLSSNSKLSNNANIDTNFSGSTAVSVLFPENLHTHPIYIANVGDSRAIVIKQYECNNKWLCESLSRDHKPNEKDEALRINRFGGRIEQYKDKDGKYVGPLRVWLSKENIPGLAMTRSFGDQLAATVGVVCEPEVKEYFIKEEDKCVVIASDGLWEYVSNESCVEIAQEYYAKNIMREELTEVLYREAKKKWKENNINIDDITIVVIEL